MDGFCMTTCLALLLSQLISLAVSSSSNFSDQSALIAFKSSIKSDPNNLVMTNWTKSSNFCDWFGVTCGRRRQRVTALDLRDVGLGGTISPHIGNLSFLKDFDLSNNSFYGYLPEEIFTLPRLVRLILQENQLEGGIPTGIKYCQKLEIVSLPGNKFTGEIPVELTTLPFLRMLYLGSNNLTGTIPPSFGNMSKLEMFGMEENSIHGIIPTGMGSLPNLIGINFYQNNLTGSIPPAIFNISSLQQLLLNDNDLSGTLPPNTGLWLPNLEKLAVENNHFSGRIPLYLSNSSKLDTLSFSANMFTGSIPTNFGQLKLLQRFGLEMNKLTSESGSSELSFLTAMINCSSLEILAIDRNPLGGVLPHSIGNFSRSLQWFIAYSCNISGQIPRGIGYLNVDFLQLGNNNLHGTIPSTIAGMERLQRLYFDGNAIEGYIPGEICRLRSLGELDLSKNKLSGAIPYCIGNLSNLQTLSLDANSLNSSMPVSLWSLENLLLLNISSNSLRGSLDIRPLKSLESIDLSWNEFSGKIPNNIGSFESIISLNLSRNSFWGPIPESLGTLITLDYLDCSHNNLSGTIPKTLEALSHLIYLNLSFNKLSGEIPSKGPFRNFTMESFMENEALCGQPSLQVSPCTYGTAHKSRWKIVLLCSLLAISSVIIFLLLLFLLRKYRKKHVQRPNRASFSPFEEKRTFSYRELCHATDNFNEVNLLGEGSFGSVYKGVLSDGLVVAIKILNLQHEGAFKSFDAECKVLCRVRHRNLVKVISSCSNPELRALILQYMSNGSLEKWLYFNNCCLDLLQRVSAMLDVALALEYLHHGQSEPVVHCDLKPSNVLLDDDMVAHVGDFGISKILPENKTETQTMTLGTLGYIAPEYGSEGKVTKKGDVYSYGIMLLETFSRKNPTNEMFSGELTLRSWVNASLPDKVLEVIDSNLLMLKDGGNLLTFKYGGTMASIQGCVLALMELGLMCSAELPDERIDIKDVVIKLTKIKSELQRHPSECEH